MRTWFPGAVYHIMHRGVRRKAIFQEEMDYQVLLQVLKNSLEKYKCILHAYCLMTNHIHLLLETGDMEIWKFMKYMSECYAMYLNHKYSYRGHVFESRYKSCLVKEDAYFCRPADYSGALWFFRNYPLLLLYPMYLNFASSNCLPHLPYIVRFIIFNLLLVPSTNPLL